MDRRLLVIAHCGASAYLPEHTLAAYALAIGQGADGMETDVVLSADGVPICLYDLWLETTSGNSMGDGVRTVTTTLSSSPPSR